MAEDHPAIDDKALLRAIRPYTAESRARSWWELGSTLVVLAGLIAFAATPLQRGLTGTAVIGSWALRVFASMLAGLVTVRGFIVYHDFMHGALLRGSKVAKAIMSVYGLLVLTPPRVWKQTHNYHHSHNAKIVGSHVGSYPMMTVSMWKQADSKTRLMYRISRHPLTVLFGYGAIFLYGMCVSGFLRRPSKNWDSALAILLHIALVSSVWWIWGFTTVFLTVLLPLLTACASGAYLFFAQHNFVGMQLQPREDWSYVGAALESSSYMELGPVMRWLTGNIGFHHVHHLSPAIPFYRLPEVHAAFPEFERVKRTRLRPSEMRACFALNLWDPERGKMVRYADA